MAQHTQTPAAEASEWDGAHFAKEQSSGVVMGLNLRQVIIAGTGLGLGMVFIVAGGAPTGLIMAVIVVLIAGTLALLKVQGVPVADWLVALIRHGAQGTRGQLSYVQSDSFDEAGAPSAGVLSPSDEVEDAQRRDKKGRIIPGRGWRFQLPGEAGELLAYELPGGAGFCYDPRTGEGLVSAKIMTSKGFALESFYSQEERTGHWRDGLTAVANLPGVLRMQCSDQTTLISGSRIQRFYESRVEDTLGSGGKAGAEVDPFLHAGLEDLMTEAQDMPVHEMWLTVVLSKEKLGKRIKVLGGGLSGFMEIALKLMSTIEGVLPPSGTQVVSWHSPRSLAGLSRSAFDPDSSVMISERSASWVGASPAQAGPMALDVFVDHLATDGYLHRVYKVSEFPQRQARLGFLDAFVFAGEFRHTVSVYYLPGDLRKAKARVGGRKATWTTSDRLLTKMDRPPSLEHQREWDDIEAEEAELVDGHAPLDIAAFVVVTGKDELELEANCADLLGRAVQANCELRVLYAEQGSGMLAAGLPFGWIKR
ncbi:PrgI family protein [Micrococcaceae sp. AOP34-BR2-30]